MRALAFTDALLRGTGPFEPSAAHRVGPARIILLAVVFGPIYGAFMGSYELTTPARALQMGFAALKVPLLLCSTTVLCLPAFTVLNTLLGLRKDYGAALRAILCGQAGMSIALASLGLLTRMWYFSVPHYRAALLFNAMMFTLATLAGHLVMLRYYRPLIARHHGHMIALCAWVAMFAFVGIQMGWMLRPFIGTPDLPVMFFRPEPFDNAYVIVARLIFS